MMSRMCHPCICWLAAMQIHAIPFQLILPYYAVQGTAINYHNALFRRENLQPLLLEHLHISRPFCMQLLMDIANGLKHIHSSELVYRDLKADNIALYEAEGCLVRAVIVDFGMCLYVSSCTPYLLTASEHRIYQQCHRHIAPDLVDDMSKPSTASDIYNVGRILKQTIQYGTVKFDLWPKSLVDVCKQCSSHFSSARPSINEIIHVLNQCC